VMSMNDFQMMAKLGQGAFSVVYKVKRKSDGLVYALKKVLLMTSGSIGEDGAVVAKGEGERGERGADSGIDQVHTIEASHSHPHVIGYKEAFFEESTSALCIVMEFAEGGDLMGKIEAHKRAGTQFAEVELWRLFIEMISGLKALHDLKILHRDLKVSILQTGSALICSSHMMAA
jgi:NIMA (never in mitosis gene a)-related kinase